MIFTKFELDVYKNAHLGGLFSTNDIQRLEKLLICVPASEYVLRLEKVQAFMTEETTRSNDARLFTQVEGSAFTRMDTVRLEQIGRALVLPRTARLDDDDFEDLPKKLRW